MVFDGQDPIYDILIGFMLVGVPMALQFFYYRANRHMATKQKQKADEEKEIQMKMASDLKAHTEKIAEDLLVKRQRSDRELSDQFDRDIQAMRKDLADSSRYIARNIQDNQRDVLIKVSTNIEAIAKKQAELISILSSRIDITDEMIDSIKFSVYEIQNDIDDIYYKINEGTDMGQNEMRERERRKKARVDEINSKKRKMGSLQRRQDIYKNDYAHEREKREQPYVEAEAAATTNTNGDTE